MVGQQAKENRELLVQTLRETARTQASMVGQLAKDLSKLYRSMDLRPQIIPMPLPPIVTAPAPMAPQPAPAAQPWMGPIQPGPMPPLVSGLPRYAREEEPAEEEQPAAPGAHAAQAAPRAHAAKAAPPESLQARLEARVAPIVFPVAGATPPEPEAARLEEAAGKGKGFESIRQALKDYLAQVRDRLERKAPAAPAAPEAHATQAAREAQEAVAPEAPKPSPAAPLEPVEPSEAKPAETAATPEGPLNFLEELAEYLPKRNPERRKNAFLRSDARMKLEYLKARIEGRPGLKARIEGELAPEGVREEGPVSLQKIADAFTFMHELAAFHPDRTLGTMLQSKLNGILRQIKE
jgi:hypothetical protein